ncbi:transcriptional regulator [Ornithobacterium rhinotracheale]|uniref:transcriptional regulator n=1 Tax=Ornithobacterium rhinotracheale TaxID=28251 RepID=UPI00129C2324|nr:transcriptional regulator [Ornithobacterium rhinotracheale]
MSNKILNIKERILYLLDMKGVAKSTFFPKIGMTYGNFTGKSKETPLNSDAIGNILSEFPDLNPEWLLTGKGEMLKGNTSIDNDNIKSENSVVGNNIKGKSVKVSISNNDISRIIELHNTLAESLKASQTQLSVSQNQINTLLEILKNK